MKRDWFEPLVQAAESWLDDSAGEAEYERFVRRSVDDLGRALQDPVDQPPWAGELQQAVENLKKTSIEFSESFGSSEATALRLPAEEQAVEWLNVRSEMGIVDKGSVERFTAIHLLSILQGQDGAGDLQIKAFVETLLRHVELRRKRCLRLSHGGSTARWFEKHDTAILLARGARKYNDLRYLNAAMKLIDWALPVHRRSVPTDLLARYVLAVSEVQLAFEALT